MKLTLMIEASADVMARVLAALPDGAAVTLPGRLSIPQPEPADDDDNEPAAAAPAGAVDSTGLLWDARIHSRNQALNADGSWRSKRNVDPALVSVVTAELRTRASTQPQPMGMPAVMQMPTVTAEPQPVTVGMPAVAVASDPAPVTWPGFMATLGNQMKAGVINSEYLKSVTDRLSQQFGVQVNSITQIETDTAKLQHAVLLMTMDGKWA